MMKTWRVLVLILWLAPWAYGQGEAKAALDVEAATRAHLDRMPPEKKAQSDAYFQGGYWLQLWNFLYGAGVAALLLAGRLSARLRDLAQRYAPFKAWETWMYAVGYLLLTAALGFPLSVYGDYFREHQYGLSNLSFGGWLKEWAIGLSVNVIMGGLLLVALFAVARRVEKTWHIWGALVTMGFVVVGDRAGAGLHRAAVQQIQRAFGREGGGADPAAGAGEWHPGGQGV